MTMEEERLMLFEKAMVILKLQVQQDEEIESRQATLAVNMAFKMWAKIKKSVTRPALTQLAEQAK